MDITRFVADLRDAALSLGDHAAYRTQLSRRLRVVRRKLSRATPATAAYAPAPVTACDIAANTEALHLLLLMSERAWAHAMAIKAAHAEARPAQHITGATRQHMLSRLHKAATTAAQMATLVAERPASGASDVDILEATAYARTLAGAEHFERQADGVKPSWAQPRRWTTALDHLATARVIYSALFTATRQDVFKDVLATMIDPSIRYAAYQNRIPRTVGVPQVARQFFPADDEPLVRAVQQLDPAALQAEEATASYSQITWRGRTANVVDAAIGQALSTVDAASTTLVQAVASSASAKERANAYDAILTASQDTVDATRRAIEELEKEGIDEGDERMQDLRVISLSVHYDLIAWRIGRNRVLIGSDDGLTFPAKPPHKPRRPRKDGKPWTARDEPTGRKLARLRERIALYDAILQSIDAIKELRGAVRDTTFIAELDGQRSYFQALKCLNLSHAYAFLNTPKQALALCSRALSLATQAAAALRSIPSLSSQAIKLVVSHQQALTLQTQLESLNAHYRGVVALSQFTESSVTASKAGLATAAPVVERLNEYPISGAVDLKNLVTWPPKMKPVPVKPLFLDVAWNYIEYPGRSPIVQQPVPASETATAAPDEEPQSQQPQPRKGWFSFGR